MSDGPRRFDHIRQRVIWARTFAVIGLLAVLFSGLLWIAGPSEGRLVRWIPGFTVVGAALLMTAGIVFLWGLIELVLKIEGSTFRIYDVIRDQQVNLQEHTRQLQLISENVQLSDMARSIMHRVKERNALRLAINEEIIKGDYEAAHALVEQLSSRHGYKNEAMRLREEVELSRQREVDEKAHEAVERVKSHLNGQHWDAARREMDRLLAQYPNSVEVRELPKVFARRRDEIKRRLLKEWDESVQRNEVDRGIEVLRELDQFLTPNEAAALEESARGVFRAKLHNMGVQFSLAVTESNWREALEVGRQIVAEFPNSRMAQEVLERMHVLSKRAQEMPVEAATTQA